MLPDDIIPKDEDFTEEVDTTGLGERLARLMDALGERVVGQPRAIKMLSERLRIYTSRLNDPRLPAAYLIFLGPTGVGKTELAKEFARLWIGGEKDEPLTQIHCENHVHGHEVASLIGSPKGYIGSDDQAILSQGKIDRHHFWVKARKLLDEAKAKTKDQKEYNVLYNEIYHRKKPYRSVILFDEIEKAHPNLWKILLHILDGAKAMMMNGEETSFTHSVIFMTSNLAAREIMDMIQGRVRTIGIRLPSKEEDNGQTQDQKIYLRAKEALERTLSPELMGRIRNSIVVFRQLTSGDYRSILDLQLAEVQKRLDGHTGRNPPILIRYSGAFKEFLLKEGIEAAYGARPLRNSVNHHVTNALAGAIISRQVKAGDKVLFDIRNGSPVLLRAPVPEQAVIVVHPKIIGDGKSDEGAEEDNGSDNK